MEKFRLRLTLTFIFLVGISVLGSGILAVKSLEDTHMDGLRKSMQREINLIMATVPWQRDQHENDLIAYFSSIAIHLKDHTDMRFTFMDETGKVLGDSDYDETEMDNHLNRPEIVTARETGNIGYSKRYSDTAKENMLNAASPVIMEGEIAGYIRLGISLSEVESAIYHLWFYYILGLLVLFAAAVLVSFRMAKRMIKPLENIMVVAQEITNKNYRSRVDIKNKDEIGKLGTAINKMAASLELQMNRLLENENRLKTVLENMISGVVMIDRDHQIVLLNRTAEVILGLTSKQLLGKSYNESKQSNELKAFIKECIEKREPIRDEMTLYFPQERTIEINLVPLTAYNEWAGVVIVMHDITAIRRLEHMRSEFVANVSHELKTPIAAVKGFAETLLNGALEDKETAKSFLQIIYDESERLNRLIMDILELSKIESKATPLQFSPVEISGFASKTVQMLKPEADKKNIQIQLIVTEEIYIEANEDRLRQILINLISNSVNYTQDGGLVKIKIEPILLAEETEYENIRIIISDTGIGIPKKDLPRIFERFYRVDKARSRVSGGTGLGLSIVKHLIELHNGTIEVQSEIGMGTRFTIELPVIQQI